jgi:hypothetical protein
MALSEQWFLDQAVAGAPFVWNGNDLAPTVVDQWRWRRLIDANAGVGFCERKSSAVLRAKYK